ncbi:MAG: hypothetical protein C4293_11550 [Nitrospiraceae bacterium]
MKDAKDLSPDIQQIVKRMETLREREQEGRAATGGPMGEEKAGGQGLSGPRALPPGEAPVFEQEKARQ